MSLVDEHRCLNGGQFGHGGVPFAAGGGEVARLERDAREPEDVPARPCRKEASDQRIRRTRAELPRFEGASLMESQSPDTSRGATARRDFFPGRISRGLARIARALGSVSLLAAGDGLVRQRFRAS